MGSVDKDIFKDLTVLYVEDEELARGLLTDFLKRRFAAVYSAKDGDEGLRLFKTYSPDIVITDIQMPVMDGLAMSKAIKDIDSDEPIVIVSAFNDIEYLLEAIDIGVEGYVSKPVDIKKLQYNLYRCALRAKYKEAQIKLSESEELFRTVAENSPNGITIIKEKIVYANKAMEDITGYSKEELYNLDIFKHIIFKDKEQEDAFREEIKRRLKGERFISRFPEIKIKTKQGKERYLEVVSNTITYKGESVTISNCLDISDRKWFEEELEHKRLELERLNYQLKSSIALIEQKNIQLHNQLYTDKLTGLPNRLKLIETIKETEEAVLILLNIDSFKEINDFYGNDVGDSILNELSLKIKEFLGGISHKFELYRLQADEYALFSLEDISHESLSALMQSLYDGIERHLFHAKDQKIHLNITSGIARGNSETILSRADMALKRAKKFRKQFLLYDKSMAVVKEYEQNLKWLKILKSALEQHRVVAFFQPIMDNKTLSITKFECLARLITEEGNIYPPFFFLDISKRSRLYENITRSIFQDAIDRFRDNNYLFSINLSIEDITDEKTIAFIKDRFSEKSIASRATFEILESEQIKNYESVSTFISDMKEYGCKIAIDDFGSGYSNFAHIINLDIDYIKIDSSIIKNADKDRNSQIISKTIVDFSKRLGIQTIAEFVHSKEVFDIVRSFGVDFSQGYYIGEPKREIVTKPVNTL